MIVLDHTRNYLKDVIYIYGGEDKQAKADVFHAFILREDSERGRVLFRCGDCRLLPRNAVET